MKHTLTILIALLLASLLMLRAAEHPNIVLILADDLGYGDLGCYGATKVKTPNIDKLACEGRRFTDAHSASSVCTPSRYALLTGEYPFRKDLWGPVMNPSPLVTPQAHMKTPALLSLLLGCAAIFDLQAEQTAETKADQRSVILAGESYRPFLGGSLDEVPTRYALASPRHHLEARDPPLMFLCGELDDPSTQADETRARLTQLGIPTGLRVIPQAPHAFLGQQSWFGLAVETCTAFFRQHLKLAAMTSFNLRSGGIVWVNERAFG